MIIGIKLRSRRANMQPMILSIFFIPYYFLINIRLGKNRIVIGNFETLNITTAPIVLREREKIPLQLSSNLYCANINTYRSLFDRHRTK